MKAITATAVLFLIAGVCVAGPQPTQRRSVSNIAEILTYTNMSPQKLKCSPGPKVYALSQENIQMGAPVVSQPSAASTSTNTPVQNFTPAPLVNYYKEFR